MLYTLQNRYTSFRFIICIFLNVNHHTKMCRNFHRDRRQEPWVMLLFTFVTKVLKRESALTLQCLWSYNFEILTGGLCWDF